MRLIVLIGVVAAVGMPVLGYYAYRTYDYVQHENEFCMSCHLMADPFERFNRSGHRGLSCKACHRPTLVERSTMALTQVIESPEEMRTHADVPNEVCAECHIEGDPEKWVLVASSVGHRVHLESGDPSLDGLQCVECHSTSVHDFVSSDETCGQSDCHTDTGIRLGQMDDLTIHCGACHSFNAVVPDEPEAELAGALRPAQGECLSCHAMREIVELPEDDPHEGLCADCHNPHTQDVPTEAVESCGVSGCHDDLEEDTPFHRGLAPSVLQACGECHQAHDFAVDGSDCRACHADVAAPRTTAALPQAPAALSHLPAALPHAPGETAAFPSRSGALLALHRVPPHRRTSGPSPPAPGASSSRSPAFPLWPSPSDTLVFRHETHSEADCLACHSTEGAHGRITVSTPVECQACHHAEPWVQARCESCHTSSATFRTIEFPVEYAMQFSTGAAVSRSLPFDHAAHEAESCTTCHTGGIELRPTALDCSECHEDHHDVLSNCMTCHVEAPAEEHPVAEVHTGCAGSGCHTDFPFDGTPRSDVVCLSCHQEQVDHRRDSGPCAGCHVLPDHPVSASDDS